MNRYLTVDEVLEINAEVVRQFGGSHGVRDRGALESAVGRPRTGYYQDAIEEAAALFESLSENHPFLDGNKRTALTATAVFLSLNGCKLVFEDPDAYQWLINLYETGQVRKTIIEAWLRDHVQYL